MPAEPGLAMQIVIPADVQFFRPVRLAVGGLGALVGFDVDAIEDLRIGVDELCGTAHDAGDGSDIAIAVTVEVGSTIRVECSTPLGPTAIDDDRFQFSRRILSVVADEHGLEASDGTIRCWLERSLSDAQVDTDAP